MENKTILKNRDKYKVLKMAKGINLGKFRYLHDKDDIFNKTDVFSNWINTGNDSVYFKGKYMDIFSHTNKHRVISELVVDKIAKQLGIYVAKYEPAHVGKNKALVSYNVAKNENQNLVFMSRFDVLGGDNSFNISFQKIAKNWNKVEEFKYYNVDKNNILFGLYKILLLDALTFQEDRHEQNIFFIINDLANTITLAPIIDNEFAFGLKTLDYYLDIGNKISTSFDTKEFLRFHGANMRYVAMESTYSERVKDDKKYQKNVKDIVKLAQKDCIYKAFLIQSLKNIDIQKAILDVEKMGYKISPEFKKYMCDLVDLAKQTFKEKIAEVKNEQKRSQCGATCYGD